jgi:hypothetical protein
MAQLTSQAYISCLFTPVQSATLAAGSSAVNGITGATVDMSGWNGVVFIWGLVGGGTSGIVDFSVRASSAARSVSGATAADLNAILLGSTSSLTVSSSATYAAFVVDIYKPRQYATVGNAAFLYPQLSIASSCAVLGQCFAIQYEPRVAGNTTARTTSSVPQSTQSSTGAGTAGQSGIFGGVVRVVSPST